ncbi:MAG: permease-like cell division protein FtsX [Methylophilaceae bacterium]
MKSWLTAHLQALQQVLKKWRNEPMSHFMMVGVIGAALSLPAGLYLVIDNLRNAAGEISIEPQISLFVALDAPNGAVKTLDAKLRENHAIKDFNFISRESAWAALQQNNPDSAGSGLEKNPLPDVFVVHPANTEPGSVETLQQQLAQLPNIEHSQLDAAWVKRLYALLQLGNRAVGILAALLGFALVAIIGNTIRLQIETQRAEIEVSQLIGATNRFIRRPFLHAGVLHGLVGGLMAWLILGITLAIFNRSIQDLALLYSSDFTLQMLGMGEIFVMLVVAAGLGWLGALLAVNRALKST